MTFTNLLTNQVMVARLTLISGSNTKRNYATVTADINVSIQKLSEEKTAMVGGAVGKLFRLYAEEDADLQVDDKLVDNDNGNEYKVNAVTLPAQLGNFVHKECIIVLVKSAIV